MHSLTEEHCRTDGVQIVISEYTHKLVHEFFDTRELDSVAVKGKAKGMAATELSVGPNLPDLAVTKDLSAETASMTQPKIVAIATKKRKMMRRNASFNALCA